MVCRVCENVSVVVRSVMIMGRWSEERSVIVFHEMEDVRFDEQKVMSGEVKLKFA